MAHLQIQGVSVAIFEADARSHLNQDRAALLQDLTVRARQSGLRVQKSALAYQQFRRTEFYGTPDLVRYLAGNGVSHWTHTLTV